MKIGITGYQGSGKSTLWEWLTGETPDPSHAHTTSTAMAVIPEDRIEPLCEIYKPKKITRASIELVDTPGLSRTHEGNATRLAMIRDSQCLVLVVAAFDGSDPLAELESFEEDLLLTDLELVSGRIERLRDQVKKPRPNRDELQMELHALLPLHEHLENAIPLHKVELTDEQIRVTKAFQLLTQKPRMIIVNTADDEENPERFGDATPDGTKIVAAPLGLELELERMDPEEREEFREEMGVGGFDRDGLIRTIMEASGQMLFFTAGDKEVRTWIIHVGGTALEAAEGIHTDLARGFIRAEVITCNDIIRLGSEREVKAEGLARNEPKNYVIQDGDIITIKFNV